MSDILEKTVNLGLGLLLYSREKVDETVEELVSKGEVAKKDDRQFATDLVQRGEEQREELKKLIRSEVAAALEQTPLAKKEDMLTKQDVRDIVAEEIRRALREQPGDNGR